MEAAKKSGKSTKISNEESNGLGVEGEKAKESDVLMKPKLSSSRLKGSG